MTSPLDQSSFANLCQVWTAQEIVFLEELLDTVSKVRQALVGGDLQQMADGLREQDKIVAMTQCRRAERQRFRQSLGLALKIPVATVTLERAAQALPSEARRSLQAARQRLRGLAAAIAKVNQANALVSHYFQDFVQRFLVDLTGGPAVGGRYGRDGAHHAPACGSLLQAQG